MSIIYFLIPIALVMLGIAIWAFIWAVNHQQFDDMDSPAHQILYDDKEERQAVQESDINTLKNTKSTDKQ